MGHQLHHLFSTWSRLLLLSLTISLGCCRSSPDSDYSVSLTSLSYLQAIDKSFQRTNPLLLISQDKPQRLTFTKASKRLLETSSSADLRQQILNFELKNVQRPVLKNSSLRSATETKEASFEKLSNTGTIDSAKIEEAFKLFQKSSGDNRTMMKNLLRDFEQSNGNVQVKRKEASLVSRGSSLDLQELQTISVLHAVEEPSSGVPPKAVYGSSKEETTEAGDDMSLEKCWNDTLHFLNSLQTEQDWALQMFDAYGKPGPAILDVNLIWLGSYDECRDVTVTQNMSSDGRGFSGQYCNAFIPIQLDTGSPKLTIIQGMCISSACTQYDIQFIFNVMLKLNLNSSLQLQSVQCSQHHETLDTKAWAAVCLCGVMAFLTIVGTLVDVVVIQVPSWRSEETLTMIMTGVDSKGEREPLLEHHLQSSSEQPGICVRVMTSFSLYTNVRKLLSTQAHRDTLTCVHGIRFLSMTWVVIGHCYYVASFTSVNVIRWQESSLKRLMFQIIANAPLSVDTFFFLSGLLVSYLSLKKLQQGHGSLNWAEFFLHRLWRLTPPYMAVLFLYVALFYYWGHGPSWPQIWPDRDNCLDNWWTNLVYVNNLVHTDKMCFGHSWYLADDMQFFIISPLVFLPFYFSPALGLLSSAFLLTAGIATPALLTLFDHFQPGVLARVDAEQKSSVNWMGDFYVKPYNRLAPYVVGLLFGYVLYRTKARLRMNKVTVLFGWLVATGLALSSLLGLYDSTANGPMALWLAILYNALGRTAWALATAWVVLACVTGHGGVVNSILSWSALVPLSRLTYCVYLLHLPLIYTLFLLRHTPFFMDDVQVVMVFLGILVVSYAVATITSLVFETPLMVLEKVVLRRTVNHTVQRPERAH